MLLQSPPRWQGGQAVQRCMMDDAFSHLVIGAIDQSNIYFIFMIAVAKWKEGVMFLLLGPLE